MCRLIYFLLLSVIVFSCKNDTTSVTEPPEKTTLTNEEKMAMLAPPPPECDALTTDEIAKIIPREISFPMPGQRGVSSFYSCQIDVDGDNWIGQVVIEFPKDPRKRQSVIDEVAGAKGDNAVTVAGNSARIMADNKKISVAGANPMRVTFTSNHRMKAEPVFTEEEVRGFLVAFAAASIN